MKEFSLEKSKIYHLHMYDRFQYLQNCIKDLQLKEEMLPSGYIKVEKENQPLCIVLVEENYYIIIRYMGRKAYTEEVGQNNLFDTLKRISENVG